MSELLLHPALFQGQTIHTLTIDGRPAWIAREVGDVLGYADSKRLVGKITLEWADDFVLGKDYALLTGSDLQAVKAEVDAVSPHAKGLLVLFESGLHLACVKTHMPLGRALRRFLVDEVLPQLVRTGAYKPAGAPEPAAVATLDTATLREARLAARVDLDDRKFRCAELRRTADILRVTRRIDGDTWARCTVAACEIALGHALPGLYAALDRWTDAAALAVKLDVPLAKVLTAASQLQLLDDKPGLSRPVPTRQGDRWTITFAFSTAAVAQIEGWLAETSDDARKAAPKAA